MKQSRARNSIISTGTTSIVLIFVLLSMLTFSVLSMVSAQADLRLSQKSAQRTTDYYTAENAANDMLIRVEAAAEETVQSRYLSSVDYSGQDFPSQVLLRLDGAEEITATADGYLSYQVPLGENQALYVELDVSPQPNAQGRYCRVVTWQAVSQRDWTPDEGMELMSLDNMPTGLK